jgi:hypothetical protein
MYTFVVLQLHGSPSQANVSPYVFAASETAKECMFVPGLVSCMGMMEKPEKHFNFRMHNTGAIYLVNKPHIRTKNTHSLC